MRQNCNSFADEFCLRLVSKNIPPFVNRLAYLGSFVSCLMPRQALENAPVEGESKDGNSSTNHSSGSMTQHVANTGQRDTATSRARPATSVFAGQGQTLTSGSPAPGASVEAPCASLDDAHARRERMRRAALARMEGAGLVGSGAQKND